MKKLITIILTLALLLPAAAMAADLDPIVGTWYMYFDRNVTPEFASNFPGLDYIYLLYTFMPDGTIIGTENDIAGATGTPLFSAAGKWEKGEYSYTYSIMVLGSGNAIVEDESLLLLVAQPNTYFRLWKLKPLNPYQDYVFR